MGRIFGRNRSPEPSGSAADLARLMALVEADDALAEALDHYNVLLENPSVNGEWVDCPPRIGRPFASDGTEHEFSLLDNGAVVLYTPLSDTPHVVVGADVREFFALLLETNGSGVGGFGYDLDRGVAELAEQQEEQLDAEELLVIETLATEFDLTPWRDHRARLEKLQELLPPSAR